jgi:hypothetical protein
MNYSYNRENVRLSGKMNANLFSAGFNMLQINNKVK